MRLGAAAALAFALGACGGGDGGELAAGNSELSPAQVDAALGPADQATVEDALPQDNGQDALDGLANELGSENAADAGNEEAE
jgi:hypothetical protein